MPKGYVTKLNGKPLTMWLTAFQLGDCRKLFRYRAACHGVTPTIVEIDEALWLALETGELPYLYSGENEPKSVRG